MGREVRMVPPTWQHPKDGNGNYIPMHEWSFEEALRQWETKELPKWEEGKRLWAEGKVKRYDGTIEPVATVIENARKKEVEEPWRKVPEHPDYQWWAGDAPSRPESKNHMPQWPDSKCTHFMMYEDTSAGTPISPAFATAEELARWLADNKASAFADETATYSQWLAMIRRGSSMASAVIIDGRWESGVAAVSNFQKD